MKQKGKFILFNKEEFKNWLLSSSFKRTIKLIQSHHTYLPGYSHFNGNNHFEKVEGMERTHIDRGFGEIAQNVTTFNDGLICICRNFDKIPCGIRGANQYGICIENLGYFDLGKDKMTEEHKTTIIFVNVLLCYKFKLIPNINSIVYHHWYDLTTGKRTDGQGNTKSCPGTDFFGGNTVEAAKKNFIPPILLEYNSLLNNSTNIQIVNKTVLPKGEVIVNINDILNVRSSPDWKASLVRTLKNGDIIEIYEEKNSWYKINCHRQCRWY